MRTSIKFSLAAFLLIMSAPASPADLVTAQDAYDNGDYQTAMTHWMELAEDGNVDAQFGVGLLYANGYGVSLDDTQALKWYNLAADQGHAQAQCNLGVMYANGWGVPQSDHDALDWYLKAAEQGVVQAQIAVANLYFSGYRIEEDKVESRKWLSIAARLGDLDASRKRDALDAYLTAEEIARSNEMAILWVNDHQQLLPTTTEQATVR